MQIDLNHLHHWMQAIRQSNNPMRTLDAFWSGQLKSKEWLITELEKLELAPSTVEIHGGWVGVLASMLFQSKVPIQHIVSVDIDPLCQHIAEEMNRLEHNDGLFRAVTDNMTKRCPATNIVINTSCEHITQAQYDTWLGSKFNDQLIVLQSNNYDIPEHIRTAQSLEEFAEQSKLNIKYIGQLELPIYTRYMIIGTKNGY
jgi:hypothetical protein